MSEPKVEVILNCIRDRVQAIVEGAVYGDWLAAYSMSPGGAVVVDAAALWEQYLLNCNLEEVALVRPGDEALVEMTTGSYTSQLEVWILAARKYERPVPDIWRPEEPRRVTMQNRLAKDVEMAILKDINNCGTSDNTEIVDVGRAFWREGWACVELRLVVTFDAQRPLSG